MSIPRESFYSLFIALFCISITPAALSAPTGTVPAAAAGQASLATSAQVVGGSPFLVNAGIAGGLERLFANGFEEERGFGEAGTLRNVRALREEFDQTDPVEPNNRQLLPFAQLRRRGVPVLDDLREYKVWEGVWE